MPRSLSDVTSPLTETVTAPGYLISIQVGASTLRFSTRGTLNHGGQIWLGGAKASSTSPSDWSLSLANHDNSAGALVLGNDVANAKVKIWSYLGNVKETLLIFDGAVNQIVSITTQRVDLSLTSAVPGRAWLPDAIMAPPLMNYLPRPGTYITWGNKVYYLEAGT